MAHKGVSIGLYPPHEAEDGLAVIRSWLLSLWQVSHKSPWRLWRSSAPISLEVVSTFERLSYQVYLPTEAHAALSRRLLRAHLPGLETPMIDDLVPAAASQGAGIITTLNVRHPGWIEMGNLGPVEAVLGVLSAATIEDEGATALVQLLLQPTWMTTEDGREPAFWLSGRLVTTASAPATAKESLLHVSGALGQFAGFNGITSSRPRRLTPHDIAAVVGRRWTRRLFPPGQPLRPDQIARLYHVPSSTSALPGLATTPTVRAPAPRTPEGVLLGEGRDPFGRGRAVRITPRDLFRHALVVGPSGAGKTTLLANLARELIAAGVGVTVIDPHGSLVRSIARAVPTMRPASLVRFGDERFPVALNPLRAAPGRPGAVGDEIVEVIQRVFAQHGHWGPLLDLLLRHATTAAAEIGGSLADSARVLDDPDYRATVLATIGEGETARVLGQLGEAGGLDRRILPAVQRLQRMLASPLLRATLGQQENAVDFGSSFERSESLLCDLSGLGMANARLIGSLLLLMVRQATFSRDPFGAPQRPHVVVVDEASWFVSPTIAELMDGARKYGVGLVLAVQRLGQLLPLDVREAVLANAATLVLFRIHDREEAALLHRHLGSLRLRVEDLQRLPRYEAYAQLTVDGERHEPAWVQTPPLPSEPPDGSGAEHRLLLAGRRFTRPRATVEAELARRDRLLTNDDPEIRSLPLAETEVRADPT